jgi:hypothetical protein
MNAVYMLPSLVEKVQKSFIEAPTASRSHAGTPLAVSLARERAIMHDTFHRQRLIEATMNTSSSSSLLHGDAAYMTAIANLRHREAMLNLDRAIHEAEKRRYNNFPYPSLSATFAGVLPGSASLTSNVSSVHNAYGVGNLARGLSVGSSSSLGSSFHGRALLHSRLGESGSGDVIDRVDLNRGILPMRGLPYSANLTSRSRERLAEVEHLLKQGVPSQCNDRSGVGNTKSP